MTSLVLQLQRDAMDEKVSLADLLRKAFVVARKLGVVDFQRWIECELNGYQAAQDIPTYRHVVGELRAFNPMRGWIPVMFEDAKMADFLARRTVGQPAPELEDMIRRGKGGFSMAFPADIQNELQRSQRYPMEVKLHLGASTLVGIVSGIRTAILEWALKLEEEGVLGEGMQFSKDEKDAASHVSYSTTNNFYGSLNESVVAQHSPHSTINMKTGVKTEALLAFVSSARSHIDSLQLGPEAKAEFVSDLDTIENQVRSPKPKSGIVAEAGKSLRTILEGAAGGMAAQLLQQLLSAL